jgi:hypothetical protein
LGIYAERWVSIIALFAKNTIIQVSGFDNECISGELVYNQKWYWNLTFTSNNLPVDLTGVTINAQIVRREISNLQDTRYGLSFDIANYTPAPTPVSLTVNNPAPATGTFTVIIDDSTWGLISSDPELNIAAIDPVCFSGRIKLSFPAAGLNPAQDQIIFLLFLVRSDGVVN